MTHSIISLKKEGPSHLSDFISFHFTDVGKNGFISFHLI